MADRLSDNTDPVNESESLHSDEGAVDRCRVNACRLSGTDSFVDLCGAEVVLCPGQRAFSTRNRFGLYLRPRACRASRSWRPLTVSKPVGGGTSGPCKLRAPRGLASTQADHPVGVEMGAEPSSSGCCCCCWQVSQRPSTVRWEVSTLNCADRARSKTNRCSGRPVRFLTVPQLVHTRWAWSALLAR
jgi:hypothetical protein